MYGWLRGFKESINLRLELTHVTDEAAAEQFIAAANAFRMQKMGMQYAKEPEK